MNQQRKISCLQKIWETGRRIGRLRISVYAANACYFIMLAVFPTLMLVLSMLRYTGMDVNYLTSMLDGVIPNALLTGAKRLILNTYYSSTGVLVSLSAVTALWASSRGIYGILTGLNNIYGVEEARGYVYTRLISVVYTFGFLVVLILTLGLHVFGTELIGLIPQKAGTLLSFFTSVVDLRFFLLLGIQTILFTALYVVLPNRRNRIGDSLPGAVLASGGWLIFTDLYSGYVNHFNGYANLYGPVYAVALSMLWLYCCISILFYGGALNAWLSRNRKVLQKKSKRRQPENPDSADKKEND